MKALTVNNKKRLSCFNCKNPIFWNTSDQKTVFGNRVISCPYCGQQYIIPSSELVAQSNQSDSFFGYTQNIYPTPNSYDFIAEVQQALNTGGSINPTPSPQNFDPLIFTFNNDIVEVNERVYRGTVSCNHSYQDILALGESVVQSGTRLFPVFFTEQYNQYQGKDDSDYYPLTTRINVIPDYNTGNVTPSYLEFTGFTVSGKTDFNLSYNTTDIEQGETIFTPQGEDTIAVIKILWDPNDSNIVNNDNIPVKITYYTLSEEPIISQEQLPPEETASN